MNTLVTELINEQEAGRGWGTTERIELTHEQANKLRKGFPEGRCPWGVTDTSIGIIRWTVFQELCWDAVQQNYREGSVLRYHLAHPSLPKKKPDFLANSIATGYALQSVLSKATIHQTDTIGTMKVEAWSVTQEHQDTTRNCWKSLKKPKTTSKRPTTRKESPIITATYTITAYRYWQHYTPTDKKEITPEDEKTLIWHGGEYCTYELEEEMVFTLTTNDSMQAEAMRKKAEEWRADYMVTALTIRIQEEGKPDQVQHLQYKRVEESKPRYAGHPEWGSKQSKARNWQTVPCIDTERKVIQFANTGKDY